ncbi:MAG TPA: hypothetical protein VNK95_04660 [Caldilineaceae bacterium]|nr:hypothetical protein [Caldilineaceae bacterium]
MSTTQPVSLPPPPSPPPYVTENAVQQALRFLHNQYNPELGLLQESPTIRPNNYFLANDALLAAYVLELWGEAALAQALRATLAKYHVSGNDFVDVAWGEAIPWPPKHFEDPGSLVETIGDAQIMTIRHDGPGYFSDWSGYANLAFMAVVNEINQGYLESARRLYEIEMSTFDGYGFPDLAYHAREGVYETLGLAWGVYAGAKLCVPIERQMLDQLLRQQSPETGGVHTHFRATADRLADPNVETTAVTLLALKALQHASCGAP